MAHQESAHTSATPTPPAGPAPGPVNCGILETAEKWYEEPPGFDPGELDGYTRWVCELQELEDADLKRTLCASLLSYRDDMPLLEEALSTILEGVSRIKNDMQKIGDGEALGLDTVHMVRHMAFLYWILPAVENSKRYYNKVKKRNKLVYIKPEDMEEAERAAEEQAVQEQVLQEQDVQEQDVQEQDVQEQQPQQNMQQRTVVDDDVDSSGEN